MTNMLLTLVVGFIVGFTFYKLKVPGGMLIGAVCGTLILSLATQRADMPYAAKFVAQVISGAFIGCSVSKDDFRQFREMYKVALVVLISFLFLNIAGGIFIAKAFRMDALTALMCTIPGGMSDVSLAAADMGAEVSTVVILQFVRMCAGLGLFPLVISFLYQSKDERNELNKPSIRKKKAAQKDYDIKKILAVFAISAIMGYIGRKLGVPAGPLIFSIIAALAVKMFVFNYRFPRALKRGAQVLSGCYIGCSISYESLKHIPALIVPAIVIILLYLINAYFIGNLLHRKFNVPIKEAMLMLAPAGASDMALISADLGVQSPSLVVMQIIRMLIAASIFPQICFQLAKLF